MGHCESATYFLLISQGSVRDIVTLSVFFLLFLFKAAILRT